MEPPGARPGRRPSKEATLRDSRGPSRGPSRVPSRGGLGAHSAQSMEGEDWDAMVKSFLKAEIERTEQRQDWLRQKLEAAKDLDADDTRGDGYQYGGDDASEAASSVFPGSEASLPPENRALRRQQEQQPFWKCMACFCGGAAPLPPVEEAEPPEPATPGGSSAFFSEGPTFSDAAAGPSGAPPPVFLPPPPEVRVRPALKSSAAARERERAKGGGRRACAPATLSDFWGELGAVFDPRRRRCF